MSRLDWTFSPISSFGEFAAEWDELNALMGGLPLLDSAFLSPLLAQPDAKAASIAFGRRDGKVIAAGILVRARPFTWQTYQPPQAPVGLWLQRPDWPLDTLAEGMRRKMPGMCLVLSLLELDSLFLPRPTENPRLLTLDYIKVPALTIWSSAEEMRAGITQNLASNLKRKKAKLAKAGLSASLEILAEPDQMEAGVNDFGMLESQGWKGRAGSAVHSDNAQGEIYRAIMQNFAARNEARIFRFFIDGRLAASDLCLLHKGVVYSLKTSYNEEFRDYSPTQLMREHVIVNNYIGQDVRRVEYYGKVKDWHSGLRCGVRQMYHVNLYRWAFLAKALRRRYATGGETDNE